MEVVASLKLLNIDMASKLEGKFRLHAKKGHIEEADGEE